MYHSSLHNFTPLFWLLVLIYVSEKEYSWSDRNPSISQQQISIWQWFSSSREGHIPLMYFRVYSSLKICGYYSDLKSLARRKERAAEAEESKGEKKPHAKMHFKTKTSRFTGGGLYKEYIFKIWHELSKTPEAFPLPFLWVFLSERKHSASKQCGEHWIIQTGKIELKQETWFIFE